jgi:tetratricopeptide (TPR) repeat protein
MHSLVINGIEMQLIYRTNTIKLFLFFTILLLSACETPTFLNLNETEAHDLNLIENPDKLANIGIEEIKKGRLKTASDAFNRALKFSPSSSGIHFLNGLTYHLMGTKGDEAKLNLAKEGYELAIKFDRSNWLARYYLGLLEIEKKAFYEAQKQFAEAILLEGNDADLLYYMAYASYYSYDLQAAQAILGQLNKVEPNSKRALQALAVVAAAQNLPNQAEQHMKNLEDESLTTQRVKLLKKRISDWEKFHNQYASQRKKDEGADQINTIPRKIIDDPEFDPEELDEDQDEAEDDFDADNEMVVVDVVIIRTEETVSTAKGTNLLQGLSVQFGNLDSGGTSGFTRQTEKTLADGETTITRLISSPAISYSLNIANSFGNRNEILARPTLVARNGQESHFFAGAEIEAGVSNAQGEPYSISKEVGVTLDMTPEIDDEGRIAMSVTARRTFLKPPSKSIKFDYSVEVSKTEVTANVIMREGETLILSGLSEKETDTKRDGTPLLQEIPIIQYFFSNASDFSFQKSVLILITPRRTTYTYRPEGNANLENGTTVGASDEVKALRAKYLDWFKPYPNTASVFNQMQSNRLYREFRTGDVKLEKWEAPQNLQGRLKQALNFLYY